MTKRELQREIGFLEQGQFTVKTQFKTFREDVSRLFERVNAVLKLNEELSKLLAEKLGYTFAEEDYIKEEKNFTGSIKTIAQKIVLKPIKPKKK